MTPKKKSSAPEEFTRSTPAHARKHKGPRLARVLSLALVAVLGLGTSVAVAVQIHINSTVTHIDPIKYVSKPKAPKDPRAGESLNILIMGTDSREGANSSLVGDHEGGERSDTTMLMHISSDRSRVDVVSIPRDTMVDVPECVVDKEGKTIPAANYTQFNNAFARGWDYGQSYEFAAACTVATVQHITGLTVDHTIIVNFEGFVDMVEALGGIEVKIPETIYSPKAANLCLPKGKWTLDGETSLQLVRARKGTGWGLEIGSDLKRIERQQAVLESTIETALSTNIVTDLSKLTSFVTASLASLTVDSGLNAQSLIGLAWKLKGLGLSDVQFYSAPVMDDPRNKNRVVFTSEAPKYWEQLKIDKAIADLLEPEPTKEPTEGTEKPKPTGTKTPSGTDKPATTKPATPQNEHKKAPAPPKTKAKTYQECVS